MEAERKIMPRFDGTGPSGKGPLTGRGQGMCGKTVIGNVIVGLAIPVIGAIVNDIRKPNGLTKRLAATIMDRISGAGRELRSMETTSLRKVETENGDK